MHGGGGSHGGSHSGGHHSGGHHSGGGHGGYGSHHQSPGPLPSDVYFSIDQLEKSQFAGRPRDEEARRKLDDKMAELGRDTQKTANIEVFTKAVDLWHKLGDRPREAQAFYHLGAATEASTYLGAALYRQKAAKAYLGAADLWHELGDRRDEAYALIALGAVLIRQEEFEQALDAYRRALDCARGTEERSLEYRAGYGAGDALAGLHRFQEAVDSYEQAVALMLPDQPKGMAWALWAAENVEPLEHAAADYARTGEQAHEAETWERIGEACLASPIWCQEGAVLFARAAGLWHELGDRHREAQALFNLGKTLSFSKGDDSFTRAAGLWRMLGDRHREAQALMEFGTVLVKLGTGPYKRYPWKQQYIRAIDAFDHALVNYRELGDRAGRAQARKGLRSVPRRIRWPYHLKRGLRRA